MYTSQSSSVGIAFGFLSSFISLLFHENLREFETYLRQYCPQTFLGQCDRGSSQTLLKKRKNPKKKSSDFFKIRILLGNTYASFPKILNFLKNSNFSAKIFDKTADCKKLLSIAKYCYSSFNSIF